MKYLSISPILTLACLVACGGNSTAPSSSSSNLSIILQSQALTSLRLQSTSCNVTVDSATVAGTCYTPLNIAGSFGRADLESSGGGTPVRILGGGNESGLSNIFKRALFDLKESPAISSDDNIQDGSASATYNYVSLHAQYLEFAFTATPASKVYRVRTFFVNNVPSTESVFQAASCRVSGSLTEADTTGTLFSGMTAQAGDILVCVKSSATETCADTDYLWVDSTNALVATRPTSPKQQSGTNLMVASSCPSDGASWGYGKLNLGFPSAVSVSAAFGDGGVKTYTVGAQSGTKLTFTLDVDVDGSLFVPSSTGITDLATANETAVLANITSILLKPMYVSKNQTTSSVDANSLLDATPTLTVE